MELVPAIPAARKAARAPALVGGIRSTAMRDSSRESSMHGWGFRRSMIACGSPPYAIVACAILGAAVRGAAALGAEPATAAASTPAPQAAEPESVRFRFAPKDASVWIRDLSDRRVSPDPTVPGDRREQQTTVRIELRYQRQPDLGWIVQQTPFEGEMSLNGEEMTNPAMKQNLGHTLKVHLNATGVAERIEGFRELERKYEKNLPPEMYNRLAKSYSADSMERMEIAQWNKPLADLIGARVATGDQWVVTEAITVGSAQLLVRGVMRFGGWTELNGRRGYKVEYDYDTTAAAVAKLVGKPARAIDRLKDQQATRSNIVLTGNVVRVIDPDTGDLIYEHAKRAYELPMNTADGPKAHYEEEQIVRVDPKPASH
jgi:hypothetical protein